MHTLLTQSILDSLKEEKLASKIDRLDDKKTEAAIEGVQASVDALKLLSGGWCLK